MTKEERNKPVVPLQFSLTRSHDYLSPEKGTQRNKREQKRTGKGETAKRAEEE
jgi:hypothetical protein